MWILKVIREQCVQTLQARLDLLKIDWWPCPLSAEVDVVVEYFVELIVELGVEMVDELVVDLLVGCFWWLRQLATVWYPLTVVHS